jgi:hypothetical protein
MPLWAFIRAGRCYLGLAGGLLVLSVLGARADDAALMPGVTASSIKIGNIVFGADGGGLSVAPGLQRIPGRSWGA